MYGDAGIGMDTVFGKLLGAGKRLATGGSLFTTVYTNQSPQRQTVAFAAPYPGKTLPMDLRLLGGTLLKRDLLAGQTLLADTGCAVAYSQGSFKIQYVGKVKTALFGGEGLFLARMTGPGTVWLKSLPFSRLASRVFVAAPQRGGSREEGGVLLGGLAAGGLLGALLQGDHK
jgi:uncharacterized protein (AIM24 family)